MAARLVVWSVELAYEVYIWQLIILGPGPQYSDFLNSAQLLTQKLLQQGYVTPRLKIDC
jgi:hypothetical protein